MKPRQRCYQRWRQVRSYAVRNDSPGTRHYMTLSDATAPANARN